MHLYDIALLTDDFTFMWCELPASQKALTTNLWLRLRRTFRPFVFSRSTDVVMTENISDFEPVAYFIKIIQDNTGFAIRRVKPQDVLRRICSYRPWFVKAKSVLDIGLPRMNKIWKRAVELNACPWINEEIDNVLDELYAAFRERQQFIRLGAYYMLIKQHLSDKSREQRRKRKAKMLANSNEVEFNLEEQQKETT